MFGEDAGAGLLLLLLITIACVAAVVHFIRIPYTVAWWWRDWRWRCCLARRTSLSRQKSFSFSSCPSSSSMAPSTSTSAICASPSNR